MPATATTNNLTKVAEVEGSLKQVQQAVQAYQVARTTFINALSGFLDKKDPGNVTLEALMKNDIMAVLCCPLAQDPVPGVQSLALSCLGKLAAADPLLSQVVVSCGILDSVVMSMSHDSAPVQAAADGVLSAVARSSTDFAERVMSAGALPPLLAQLHSAHTPATVKESAVRSLDSLIQSSVPHAAAICTPELLSTLVALMCSSDSPNSLCKIIVQCLGNVAACSSELAAAVVAQKVLDPLTRLVRTAGTPPDLKAAALHSLSHVSRHDENLANLVAGTGVINPAVQALTDKMTPAIRRNAAAMLLQMVQKTAAMATRVSSCGAPGCLKQYMQLEKGNPPGALMGLMIAGSMSTFGASIAKALVDSGAGQEVVNCIGSSDAGVSGTAAWAVEQAAMHGPDCTMPLIAQGALQELMSSYAKVKPSQADLKSKTKTAIKAVIRSCNLTAPLEVLVAPTTPPEIARHLLSRLVPLLQDAPKARQQFVTSGALARLQVAIPTLCPRGQQQAEAINALFPTEVVTYYEQGTGKTGSLSGTTGTAKR